MHSYTILEETKRLHGFSVDQHFSMLRSYENVNKRTRYILLRKHYK